MSEQVPIAEQLNIDDSAKVTKPNESNDLGDIQTNDDESMKNHLEEMEKEAVKLRELHTKLSEEVDQDQQEKRDIDARSIYIGNVDYGTTPLELQQHFSGCGVVNRVTIPTNKFNGQPKGFAYLEFADVASVDKAVATLDQSQFRDRELKVMAKRTNVPGLSSTNRGSFRGRGSLRGFRGGFRGRWRGARGFRGSSRFTPY